MVEGKLIGIGDVAYVLGMRAKKLHRWYQKVLSGFEQAKQAGLIGKDDIEVKEKGSIKQVKVPVSNSEAMGTHMAIDEKEIDGDYYTILSNRLTGKIALMIKSLKTQQILQAVQVFGNQCFEVQTVTRDLANNYDWLVRQAFMNASHIADKFHIIKLGLEAVQSLRITYRKEELQKRKLAYKAHQERAVKSKQECKSQGIKYEKAKFEYVEAVLKNGDTVLQLLARSRGLLFKLKSDWSESQQQRAELLFKTYPKLKTAYHHLLAFRKWIDKDQIHKAISIKKRQLIKWCEKAEAAQIDELSNFVATVKTQAGFILNYFKFGATNAPAEALNRNIKRFIGINYGVRNSDYFFYRLKNHFT